MADSNAAPGAFDAFLADYVRKAEAQGVELNKIVAIKALRKHGRMGLKEAKDVVESFGERHNVPKLVRQPMNMSALLGCLGILIGFVACAAYLISMRWR